MAYREQSFNEKHLASGEKLKLAQKACHNFITSIFLPNPRHSPRAPLMTPVLKQRLDVTKDNCKSVGPTGF